MPTKEKREKAELNKRPLVEKIENLDNTKMEDWETDEGILLLSSWIRDGVKITHLHERMGVTYKTFWEWRKKSPILDEVCKKSREIALYEVENALFKAAKGYTKTTVKTYIGRVPKRDKSRDVGIEKTVEQVGPNVMACLAILNNMDSDKWKRNRDNEQDKDKYNNVTINIIKGEKDEIYEGEPKTEL